MKERRNLGRVKQREKTEGSNHASKCWGSGNCNPPSAKLTPVQLHRIVGVSRPRGLPHTPPPSHHHPPKSKVEEQLHPGTLPA